MSLLLDFPSFPFYEAEAAVAAEVVPGRFPVALAGHPYIIDTASGNFLHRSIPILREQTDIQNAPSESSLNPQGLWRRGQDTWHHGAGQTYLDRPESDNARFRSSKGIDVWTRQEMSLLWDTRSIKASVNANLQLAVAGDRLYVLDGGALAYTTDATVVTPTWTTVTGTPATAPSSLASDGFNILSAHGADGVSRSTRSVGTAASYLTGTASVVAWVKDRIMVASGPSIYNPTTAYPGPAALPAAHYTHRNTDFAWVGFAEGQTVIYAAGYSGDKSVIYRIPLKSDGTGLDAPLVAATLPDGEIVRSIFSYLGFVFIGTDNGLRFAIPDTTGNLTIGALIQTSQAVRCFEGQDRFIWFGLSNYDNLSTGLGRTDPTAIDPDDFSPAWASDLMATAQGTVTSVVTFQDRRVFAVSGQGIYVENRSSRVASGTLDTGLITFGLPEPKVAVFLDVRYRDLQGSHRAWLAEADREFSTLGTHTEGGNLDQFPCGQVRSEAFEIREELIRDTTDATLGPVLIRHTLKAEVAADVGTHIFVPVILASTVQDLNGTDWPMDVAAELAFITDLRSTRTIVVYQEGTTTYSVTVEDYEYTPHHLADDRSAYAGTVTMKLKRVI